MLNWFVNNWDKFGNWVTSQPTFVEVAFGVGLFYVVLKIAKAVYKLIGFLFSGLITVPGRFKKQKDLRVNLHSKKQAATDDEAPPFVFR